jgi:hypothetical protein
MHLLVCIRLAKCTIERLSFAIILCSPRHNIEDTAPDVVYIGLPTKLTASWTVLQ